MSTIQFHAGPLAAAHVDDVNGIVRGVSVITSGLIARGHDLEVDHVTLDQMRKCAEAKGRVPVKIDHCSGAGAVCGFLTNFQLVGNKLKADWHLLQSHPQRDQILETVHRMPRGVGLSAAFISPDTCPTGKARCQELVSVDYVTLPAANPDGMFAAQPALRRVTDSISNQVDVHIPGSDGARTAARLARKPLVRRVGVRVLKVAAGAAGGAVIGRRYGPAAGALTGAVAGLLFEDPGVRNTVRLATIHAKQLTRQ